MRGSVEMEALFTFVQRHAAQNIFDDFLRRLYRLFLFAPSKC